MAGTSTTQSLTIRTQVEDIQGIGDEIGDESKLQTPTLAVDIKTSFPQSEIFGVKLVNGRPTKAVLDVSNKEPAPITLAVIGGSLLSDKSQSQTRNLTAQRYGVQIPAGESESVTYSFATEMHPQDLRLSLAAVLQNSEGAFFTKMVFNETVSIVEAPMSIFDPQMYLPHNTPYKLIPQLTLSL